MENAENIYSRLLFRLRLYLAVRMPNGDAEDVAAETIAILLDKYRHVEGEDDLLRLAFGIAANKRMASMRKTARRHEVPFEEIHYSGNVNHPDEGVLLSQMDIDKAIAKFSSGDRAIFWKYFRAGFTAAQIADMPDVKLNPKGVESKIYRMVTELRNKLGTPK